MTPKDVYAAYQERLKKYPMLQAQEKIDRLRESLALINFPICYSVLNNTNVDVCNVVRDMREWYTTSGELRTDKIASMAENSYVGWMGNCPETYAIYDLLNELLDMAVANKWWTFEEAQEAGVEAGMWAAW